MVLAPKACARVLIQKLSNYEQQAGRQASVTPGALTFLDVGKYKHCCMYALGILRTYINHARRVIHHIIYSSRTQQYSYTAVVHPRYEIGFMVNFARGDQPDWLADRGTAVGYEYHKPPPAKHHQLSMQIKKIVRLPVVTLSPGWPTTQQQKQQKHI